MGRLELLFATGFAKAGVYPPCTPHQGHSSLSKSYTLPPMGIRFDATVFRIRLVRRRINR